MNAAIISWIVEGRPMQLHSVNPKLSKILAGGAGKNPSERVVGVSPPLGPGLGGVGAPSLLDTRARRVASQSLPPSRNPIRGASRNPSGGPVELLPVEIGVAGLVEI